MLGLREPFKKWLELVFHIVLVLLLWTGRVVVRRGSSPAGFQFAGHSFITLLPTLLYIVKGLNFETHSLTEGSWTVDGITNRGANDGILPTEGDVLCRVCLVRVEVIIHAWEEPLIAEGEAESISLSCTLFGSIRWRSCFAMLTMSPSQDEHRARAVTAKH